MLLFACSCNKRYTNINIQRNSIDSMYLRYNGNTTLQLDSHTPNDWNNTYIIEYKDSVYVLVFNTYTAELNYFNKTTEILEKQIKYNIDDIDGIYVHENSIYAHNYKKCTFFHLQPDGKILDTIKINSLRYGNGHYPPYLISTFNGVYPINKEEICFTTYSIGESLEHIRHCGMIFNKENGQYYYIMPFPEIYSKANWGGGMYRIGYTTYNPKNNYIIYSFPASHYINVYNLNTNSYKEYYAGSKNIDRIPSYPEKPGVSVPDNKSFRHYISNSNYGAILYDRYRELYYRIVEIAGFHKEKKYQYLKIKKVEKN